MQDDRLQSRASLAIGRLDGLAQVLPAADLLLYFYSRREAVLSSQIEGTQSSLSDLLMFEADPQKETDQDVQEVSNYVVALRHGLDRMRGGFPLSLRLVREMHEKLMQGVRGGQSSPGGFRRSQNWIAGSRPGNAIYVPPPVPEMEICLDEFEKFLHGGANEFTPLVQAAMLHVQFESIHPFLDGNGRLGRLLIGLLLVERNVLKEPLLYLSLYLKQNKSRYYQHLQDVRTKGTWEEWAEFFLEGVAATAESAVVLAQRLLVLFERDQQKLQEAGRQKGSLLQIFHVLRRRPYLTIPTASQETRLSSPTVIAAMETLVRMGMVQEISGRQRGRLYAYRDYLDLLEAGTEPAG
jgi:Fic family protein